jgi:hypothetical protein
MRKSIFVVLLAVCFAIVSGTVEARDRVTHHVNSDNTVTTTHMSAPERMEHHSNMTFGLGVSSISPISQTGGVAGSMTGILGFTDLDALQLFVGIPATTGAFQFGVGALYKRTVVGNSGAGLHVGGGMGIGTNSPVAGTSSFCLNIDGVVGVHYALANSNLAFHFDGGPVFTIQSVPNGLAGSSTVTSFGLGALSTLLGASVVYMF